MKARGRFRQVFVARFRAGDSIAFEVRYRPKADVSSCRKQSLSFPRRTSISLRPGHKRALPRRAFPGQCRGPERGSHFHFIRPLQPEHVRQDLGYNFASWLRGTMSSNFPSSARCAKPCTVDQAESSSARDFLSIGALAPGPRIVRTVWSSSPNAACPAEPVVDHPSVAGRAGT